jgi:hypothetical protein
MIENKKAQIQLQGQEGLQTDNKEKPHNSKESKKLSNKKLKFTNPSRRRQNYQTISRN